MLSVIWLYWLVIVGLVKPLITYDNVSSHDLHELCHLFFWSAVVLALTVFIGQAYSLEERRYLSALDCQIGEVRTEKIFQVELRQLLLIYSFKLWTIYSTVRDWDRIKLNCVATIFGRYSGLLVKFKLSIFFISEWTSERYYSLQSQEGRCCLSHWQRSSCF